MDFRHRALNFNLHKSFCNLLLTIPGGTFLGHGESENGSLTHIQNSDCKTFYMSRTSGSCVEVCMILIIIIRINSINLVIVQINLVIVQINLGIVQISLRIGLINLVIVQINLGIVQIRLRIVQIHLWIYQYYIHTSSKSCSYQAMAY